MKHLALLLLSSVLTTSCGRSKVDMNLNQAQQSANPTQPTGSDPVYEVVAQGIHDNPNNVLPNNQLLTDFRITDYNQTTISSNLADDKANYRGRGNGFLLSIRNNSATSPLVIKQSTFQITNITPNCATPINPADTCWDGDVSTAPADRFDVTAPFQNLSMPTGEITIPAGNTWVFDYGLNKFNRNCSYATNGDRNDTREAFRVQFDTINDNHFEAEILLLCYC